MSITILLTTMSKAEGPVWGPDLDSHGLVGEVGCVRGQALPCMEQQD